MNWSLFLILNSHLNVELTFSFFLKYYFIIFLRISYSIFWISFISHLRSNPTSYELNILGLGLTSIVCSSSQEYEVKFKKKWLHLCQKKYIVNSSLARYKNSSPSSLDILVLCLTWISTWILCAVATVVEKSTNRWT